MEDVPLGLKTPKLCLEAVMQDSRVLAFVLEKLKMQELCQEAVWQAGESVLQWVLEGMRKVVLDAEPSKGESTGARP